MSSRAIEEASSAVPKEAQNRTPMRFVHLKNPDRLKAAEKQKILNVPTFLSPGELEVPLDWICEAITDENSSVGASDMLPSRESSSWLTSVASLLKMQSSVLTMRFSLQQLSRTGSAFERFWEKTSSSGKPQLRY